MELLKNFGIEPVLFLAQIVNFLVILYVLKRFLYKPVFNMLKEREEKIKRGLEQAKQAQELLEKAGEREKSIIRTAQQQAKILMEDAKKQREGLLQQSRDDARKQTDEMLKQAKELITYETREAEKKLTRHVSELAVKFLEKSSSQIFAKSDQDVVMKTAIKKLKGKVS